MALISSFEIFFFFFFFLVNLLPSFLKKALPLFSVGMS